MKIYAKIYAYCLSCDTYFTQYYRLQNNGHYEWVPDSNRNKMPDVFVELERWIKCGEKSHWGECAKFDESDLNGHNS